METSDSRIFAKREVPKIAGSAAAFVALVVVLVLIIIASGTAVVLLLRAESTHDAEAASHRTRKRYEAQTGSSKKWYSRILDLPGFGSRSETSKHKSNPGRSGHGWQPAGNGTEWESESEDEEYASKPQKHDEPSTAMRMKDYDPSLNTKRSSTGGSSPHISRVYSMASDNSSVRFEEHAIRGLPYNDVYAPSPQRTIPSIHSQLYSPSTSPPSILRQPSRMLSSSPPPVDAAYSNDTTDSADRHMSIQSGPSVRTFGGSKFVESL